MKAQFSSVDPLFGASLLKLLTLVLIMTGVTGCSEFGHNNLKLGKGKLSSSSIGTPLLFNYRDPNNTNYYQKLFDAAGSDAAKKAIRNDFTLEVMDVIDKDFDRFKKDLRKDYAYKETIVKLISLGLSGAGSLAAKDTANILAAIDTGLKGANDAVNLQAWANDAPEILINEMIALRDPIKAQIYTNLTKDVSVYPLSQAKKDLGDLYLAASVTEALRHLNTSTGSNAATASGKAEDAKAFMLSGRGAGNKEKGNLPPAPVPQVPNGPNLPPP